MKYTWQKHHYIKRQLYFFDLLADGYFRHYLSLDYTLYALNDDKGCKSCERLDLKEQKEQSNWYL